MLVIVGYIIIIISVFGGFALAGGHLGFGLDWAKYDLQTIVNEIAAYLAGENLSIPLVAAGGIFTGSDAVSFLEQHHLHLSRWLH